MPKKSNHPRACPKCGLVVEWTRHPRQEKLMPNGELVSYTPLSLECPEHGPFDNMTDRLNEAWARVSKGFENHA
jgi:hypothetical protein